MTGRTIIESHQREATAHEAHRTLDERAHLRQGGGPCTPRSKNRYAAGESESLEDLKRILDTLIGFYPRHIEKEDKHFFFPTQEHFSKTEQEVMLQEFEDFDAKMIHEKYSEVIKRIEGG